MADTELRYTIGTVSVAADGTLVTLVGGDWSGVNARQWDTIQIDPDNLNIILPVTHIVDSLHLNIPKWKGGAKTNVPYILYQNSNMRIVGAKSMADVDDMLAKLNTEGWYRYVNPAFAGPTEQGIVANEGQFALKYTTGQLWIMTGGVWVIVGIYRALFARGTWNIGTAYNANDIVAYGGSSYIAIASSTGVAPTNTSYWMINAGQGGSGTIAIGTVTGLAAGAAPTVTNSGSSTAAVVNFGIPKGDKGDRSTIAVGGVTTGAPGTSANVSNTGTATDAIFAFTIPRGDQGQGVNPNATGTLADKATHDAEVKGYVFIRTDINPFQVFIKASNASGDWAGPTYLGGTVATGDWGLITSSIVETFDYGSV